LVPIIAPGDVDKKSWDTQCDFVFPFKGTEDTVQMYCGDRWKRPHVERGGDYVWLPITFTPRDSVVLEYHQDWEVEPDLGLWRLIDEKRNLALGKTATASSESGGNTAGKVTDQSTWKNYYNSKWVSGSGDQQWISIDLGSAMKVNRVILKWDSSYAQAFEIQVSTDNSTWEDVFSTTIGRPRSITDETFPTTTARYVRMNGTKKGGSNGYTLFDFMVLNDSVTTSIAMPSTATAPVSLQQLTIGRDNMVHYRVPSDNTVTIDVVDSRGKRVATLVNGLKHAGEHAVELHGTLARGMYIIRMATRAELLTVHYLKL
ncbi:MAG: discoidin domain-containing protein, partial [Chitinispirillaceae bacterium]|nr:discoidin domain-containing protein [Chitinispirillaceae bacterium]